MAVILPLGLIIGVIGSILLIIAWIWETWENYKKHKINIHIHFAILYAIGNSMLLYYSWQIKSSVFFVLSIILILAILIETIYSLALAKKR